jgi:type VII secretion integral membrane protein EccD
MDDPLCRISIHNAVRPEVVDVALPRHAEVGLLLPDIVDLVIGNGAPAPAGWRLDRLLGGPCDESMTLHESGISDGDVMVLSPVGTPAPGPLHDDPFRTVRDAEGPEPGRDTSAARWACAGLIAVATLGYSGAHGGLPWLAAGTAVLGAAICILVAWRRPDVRVTVHGLCCGFVSVAGFLAVPGGAWAPGVALGAAAGCAVSVCLLRAADGDVWLLTATATAAALVTAATAVALVLPVDLAAAGAILGVLALAVLGAAGRLAITLTGLRPPLPGEGSGEGAAPISAAAAAGGRTLGTGLVTGAGAAVTVGAVALVFDDADGSSWPRRLMLAAVFAALLLLRIRFHADPRCRTALGWCGLVAASAALALATVSAPRYAGPVVVLTVALVAWSGTRHGERVLWVRGADIAECVLLAAVVPLAGWVCGLYELVRSSSIG